MTPSDGDERGDDPDTPRSDGSFSTTELVGGAYRRLRANPSTVLALLAAGVVVTGLDQLVLRDPIPTVGFRGIQDGHLAVSVWIVVTVLSRASVPASSLVGLKLPWLAWALGLRFLGFAAVTGAGAYALARLLGVSLTARAILRYAVVVALVWFGSGRIDFEGGAILLAIPLIVAWFVVLVRLFAFPGLLLAGVPMWAGLRRSWTLTRGHGWPLFGVVLLVGVSNHLLASVPLVGPLGSALVGAVHAGTVAAFLGHTADLDG